MRESLEQDGVRRHLIPGELPHVDILGLPPKPAQERLEVHHAPRGMDSKSRNEDILGRVNGTGRRYLPFGELS